MAIPSQSLVVGRCYLVANGEVRHRFPWPIVGAKLVAHSDAEEPWKPGTLSKSRFLTRQRWRFFARLLRMVGRRYEEHFKGDAAATKHARVRLAYAVLLVARQDDDNADQVKDEALQVMALAARGRIGSRS